MWQNPYEAYLENRVLSADPMELIRLLYQAATGAVRNARHHLASGDIAARARCIANACEILFELTGSLDHARGGEISRGLALLYDYMTRRLVEANFRKSDAPLAEVLTLLTTLSEAWNGLKQTEAAPPPVAAGGPWAPAQSHEPPAVHASQAWSL